MAHPSPSLLFLSQIRWVTGCEVVSGRAAVGLSIEAESELLVVASSATMTLNKRPGNEARGWRWSILREPRFWRPRVMLSKLLAFGKLGNDDFCEVSIVAFFSFYV
uniref:DUF3778 domain-containing protein n=1 Tax=Oryza rufipogon TaxID=4529 RepID=A0A0E0Q5R5_ORYRU